MKNPIYRKEWKRYARSRRLAAGIGAAQLVLSLVGLFVYYVSFVHAGNQGSVRYADILAVYRILAAVEFALVMLVMPAVLAGAVCGERERQTLEILLSTTLPPRRFLFGKLFASLQVAALLLCCALPVFSLVFSVGGVTLRDLAGLYVFLLVYAFIACSISIFFSTFCKTTTAAGVASYLALFVTTLLSLLLCIGLYALSAPAAEYADLSDVYYGWVSRETASHNWNLLLLLNPLCSFFALLKKQTGTFPLPMLRYGSERGLFFVLREHWLAVSLALQSAVALFLDALSVRRLERR